MEGIGSGAVTAPFGAAKDSDCMIIIGARPEQNHPVAATFLKNAAKRGAKIIDMDPRGPPISRYAYQSLQFKPGHDVALLKSILHTHIRSEAVRGGNVVVHPYK